MSLKADTEDGWIDDIDVWESVRFLALGIALFVTLFPIYWLVVTAIKPPDLAISHTPSYIPTQFSLENFRIAFERIDLARLMANSLIVSTVSTVLTIAIGAPAAYAFARYDFKYSDRLFVGIVLARMAPYVVIILPLYIFLSKLNLLDTKIALIWIYTALNLPLAIWIIENYIREIPESIEEASQLTGATTLTTLRRVIVPLAKPGLFAAAVLNFILAWNEFFFAYLITSEQAQTLPVGLISFVQQFNLAWGAMAAVGVIMLLPPILLVGIVSDKLIDGLQGL